MTHASELPQALYRAEQVRELDRIAIEDRGIAGIVLMKRAGEALFKALESHWPQARQLTVFCGGGNNGGDGYVLAALAAKRNKMPRVIALSDPAKLVGDAKRAYAFARQEGVEVLAFDSTAFPQQSPELLSEGVVVDALLGTGLNTPVRGDYLAAINAINASELPVLAADIPSGLCSDTGSEQGCAVSADVTVTFIGLKQGLFSGRGPALVGELVFDQLDVPEDIYSAVLPTAHRLPLQAMQSLLAPRQADAHKGDFGHVMVIGGDLGMGGAALMAGEAAARVGAGLVSVATRPEHVAAFLARSPELMVNGVPSGQALEPLLSRPDVLVVGPGLGRSPWSEQMLQQAFKSGLPMVMDADALNIMAEGRVIPKPRSDQWVLTPHPGEAARLLGCDTQQVSADRFTSAQGIQTRYGGVVVLKGAGSLVASAEDVGVVAGGNPGMASGGMGDVLSGIIGGLIAQGLSLKDAAGLGASVHAAAGDLVAAEGARGMKATDLLPFVRKLVNV